MLQRLMALKNVIARSRQVWIDTRIRWPVTRGSVSQQFKHSGSGARDDRAQKLAYQAIRRFIQAEPGTYMMALLDRTCYPLITCDVG